MPTGISVESTVRGSHITRFYFLSHFIVCYRLIIFVRRQNNKLNQPFWLCGIRWPRRAFRVLLLSCDFSRILRSRDTLFYISHLANRVSHFAFRVWHFPFCVSQIAFRILCFAFCVSRFAFRVSHFWFGIPPSHISISPAIRTAGKECALIRIQLLVLELPLCL